MTLNRYQLDKVTFPAQICILPEDLSNEFEWLSKYKVEAKILSNNVVSIRFGIQLYVQEEVEGVKPNVTVEALGLFELSGEKNQKIPEVKTLGDVPLIPNLLTSLYPYLRERVSNFFGSNLSVLHLPSFNIPSFLKETASSTEVIDLRNGK